ncbi:MAG: hypothetical protein IPO21_18215 [Bacteroidales bacterium]|nr:hypothetical protein [Bacteroidales bacterium]
MELDDKIIKNILASDSEPITVPAWNSFSATVKKNNFMQFGFRHLNIYTVSVLALFCIGLAYFGFSNSDAVAEGVQTTAQPIEQTIQKPSVNVENTANQTTDAIQPETKSIEKAEPTAIETNKAKDYTDAPTNEPKHVEKIEAEKPASETAPVVMEQAKNETTVNATTPKQTHKGKTVIVFETDTVVEIDTLVVDKKIKKR